MTSAKLQLAAASSSQQEASHAPIPPKEGPTEYVGGLNTKPLRLLDAHGGHFGKDSTSVEQSQGGQENAPAALKQNGDRAQLSACGRGARASGGRRLASDHPSPVRLTDGEALVAQPGSAPQPELPVAEVPRSNRGGSSTSTDEQVTKVRAQLQASAGRPASVSDCLTGSAAAQPASLFLPTHEHPFSARRPRAEAPRGATAHIGRAA